VVLLDARQACSFADYIVICSGETDRQIDAVLGEITTELKKAGVVPYHSEGNSGSGWVLLDCSGVVIHVFSRELRDYYRLDSVYERAPQLLRIQ
jgi:ribosome-associated protein